MKYYLLLIGLIFYTNLASQEFDDLIKKSIESYEKSDSFLMKTKYTIFKDSTSNTIKDEQEGKFIKKDNNYLFRMANSEIIFTEEFYLKMSHLEKIILYSKIDEEDLKLLNNQLPFVDLVQKFESKNVISQDGYWECVLYKSTDKLLPYSKIKLLISKSTYNITKQIYYFNSSIEKRFDSNAKDTTNERLEISQMSFKENPEIEENLFNLEKYIKKVEGRLTTTSYTKDYQIITR